MKTMKFTKNFFTPTLIASALALSTTYANAAAFQLAEISSSGLGRAYAGEAAIADNAAVVATNPALMSLFNTKQFSIGGVYVQSKINLNGELEISNRKSSADQKDVIPSALVPNMYFVAPITHRFAVGAGMNTKFGLKSQYSDDYNAGLLGGKTELASVNLNLSGSYRLTKGLSVGAGLNAIYAKAKIERRAGAISIPISIFKNNQLLTQLEDNNAWGFGWNIGAVYEFNQGNRIGITYHSKVDLHFKDHDALSYKTIKAKKGKGRLTLPLPDYLEISGFHQLTENFAMHYSYKYTKWSRLQRLHAVYDDGTVAFSKEEKFHDTSRLALGATYHVNDKFTLRAGIAYDESADHPTASIPDTDRTWYSVGATYDFTPNLSVDFGFAHLRGKKQQFKETQKASVTVDANYQSTASANLYGLNLNYRF